jgi:hypothetical protein
MKTRKEVLGQHHDSALTKLLEEEINLKSLKNRVKETKPGTDFNKLQESIKTKELNIKIIEEVLKIIEELYGKEK